MRADPRPLFTAASKAQQTIDYLHNLQPLAPKCERSGKNYENENLYTLHPVNKNAIVLDQANNCILEEADKLPKADPAKLAKVELSLPFGFGKAEWISDPTERKAAWALYVELVTRVATEALNEDEGLLREALTSLYSLFASTRQILRDAGPAVGISHDSLGGLAIGVLNIGLRPFLAKWHPLLLNWEAKPHPDKSAKEHEREWSHENELREKLEVLRHELKTYADALATIAGINN